MSESAVRGAVVLFVHPEGCYATAGDAEVAGYRVTRGEMRPRSLPGWEARAERRLYVSTYKKERGQGR